MNTRQSSSCLAGLWCQGVGDCFAILLFPCTALLLLPDGTVWDNSLEQHLSARQQPLRRAWLCVFLRKIQLVLLAGGGSSRSWEWVVLADQGFRTPEPPCTSKRDTWEQKEKEKGGMTWERWLMCLCHGMWCLICSSCLPMAQGQNSAAACR